MYNWYLGSDGIANSPFRDTYSVRQKYTFNETRKKNSLMDVFANNCMDNFIVMQLRQVLK